MKIGSANQLRMLDKYAIEELGISGVVLMERAGLSVIEELNKIGIADKKIVIVCGHGNNGGDGFVIARNLLDKAEISVVLIGQKSSVHGDAKINLEILKVLGCEVKQIDSTEDFDASAGLSDSCIILDCIFGTGLCREVEGLYKEIIHKINNSKAFTVSVDLPSGIHSDNGEVLGIAVRADKTVTFAIPKLGMFLYPGREYCGEIIVKDIGIPKIALKNQNIKVNLTTVDYLKLLIKKRKENTHKGTYGKVLILGGSRGFTGAPVISSTAALYSGSGIVSLGLPESIHDIAEAKLTEVITYPLKDKDYYISIDAVKQIKELIDKNDVLALGMGMGIYKKSEEVVSEIIKYMPGNKYLVLDADGLNNISKNIEVLKNKKCGIVLTPHPGEMARLMNVSIEEIEKNRIHYAKELSKTYDVCVVLKGRYTTIAYNEEVFINPTGNPGMAQGGSGDALCGIIASLLGQGLNVFDAAICGVFLHGLSADILKEKIGDYGITAMNIAKNVPYAIKHVIDNN
jgi:hydroxyethylthiazole kinase-like uncharacterized protein yjeF